MDIDSYRFEGISSDTITRALESTSAARLFENYNPFAELINYNPTKDLLDRLTIERIDRQLEMIDSLSSGVQSQISACLRNQRPLRPIAGRR